MRQNIELLAPAGSYEAFEAALGAGADAVYVGGALFGARAYAKNFEKEELLTAIDMAHIHGKKLYLTVNTLLKNQELTQMLPDYLRPFYEAGLDAVIVQDMGVLSMIREEFPGLPIHASTQMAVTGPAGMKFLEGQGAARVVAARELSLSELARMHEASPIEIEAFIHGALCYSYSGQCLMSSLIGGRSGNRGKCAQPCRLPYSLSPKPPHGQAKRGSREKAEEFCPLSLKDICTLEILPEILDAGVTSLKIEGRMKQPGYTAGVTAMYRKYLDILLDKGPDRYHVEEKDKKYLLSLFNRGGSCTGYYKTQNGPAMMAFTNEKKTSAVSPEIRKRKEKIYGNLILFPGSPVILKISCRDAEVAVSLGEVQQAKSQPMEESRIRQQMDKLGNTPFVWERLDIRMDGEIFVPVKVLNEVRRMALEALEEKLTGKFYRKAPPEGICKGRDGAWADAGKISGTSVVSTDSGSISGLSAASADRGSISGLSAASADRGSISGASAVSADADRVSPLPLYVSCEDSATAEALCGAPGVKGLYLPFRAMEHCLKKGLAYGKEMYLSLPHITRGEAPPGFWEQAGRWLESGMYGFLVRNLESYGQLAERGLASRCVLDHSLYTWNDRASVFWKKQGALRNTVPLELNEKELRRRDNRQSEMIVYGRLPLMVSAQCVRKNIIGCNHGEEMVQLKDRCGKEFPVVCCCDPWKTGNTRKKSPCYNILYNSIPFGLLKESHQVEALGVSSIRLSFTIEGVREAKELLDEFQNAYQMGGRPRQHEFTKGHFKRGAE